MKNCQECNGDKRHGNNCSQVMKWRYSDIIPEHKRDEPLWKAIGLSAPIDCQTVFGEESLSKKTYGHEKTK